MSNKELTAEQMIDITRMRTLYGHLQNNPDITDILQAPDNNEKRLAELGQAMIDGDIEVFEPALRSGELKILTDRSVPETNAVYCLYIPPYYVFTDLKKKYQ